MKRRPDVIDLTEERPTKIPRRVNGATPPAPLPDPSTFKIIIKHDITKLPLGHGRFHLSKRLFTTRLECHSPEEARDLYYRVKGKTLVLVAEPEVLPQCPLPSSVLIFH